MKRFFLMLALAGVPWGYCGAQEQKQGAAVEKHSITVSGHAELKVKPDIAHINVGVVANAPSAAQALAENSKLMNGLFDVLKGQGIEEKDIKTSNLSVQPQYSQPQQGVRGEFVPRIVGYSVTNTVSVTIRKIDKLGPMLDLLIQNGANQVYGVSFDVDDFETRLDAVRGAAVKDARRRAELYCSGDTVKPGRVLHIAEAGANIPSPEPVYGGVRMRMMAADAMAAPVAAGEQRLSVRVQVQFELVEAK